jgi:hypothetical protein
MRDTEEVLTTIDGHLKTLEAEIAVLERARGALAAEAVRPTNRSGAANGSVPTREPATKPRKRRQTAATTRRRRRARSSVASEHVSSDRLEQLLSTGEGMTTTALTEETGGPRDRVLALLRELEAKGRVRRTGERRSTRWHAITDEDRIARRAAELAAQSRSARGS